MVLISGDDWRRQGQEKFLKGKTLKMQRYTPYRVAWDHDHCEFCSAKLSSRDGDIHEGYATQDHYHWVCINCFEEFRGEYEWLVEE